MPSLLVDIDNSVHSASEPERLRRIIYLELADAQLILEQARASVLGISKNALSCFRSERLFPQACMQVLSAVLLLLGGESADCSLRAMKMLLRRHDFKDMLVNFDSVAITPRLRNRLEAVVRESGKSFESEVIKRSSHVVAPLAAWVTGNIFFAQQLERVQPLLDKVRAQQADPGWTVEVILSWSTVKQENEI